MEKDLPNQFNHAGLIVRMVTLEKPPYVYAFVFDSGTYDHTILAILTGTAELVFNNGSYSAKASEIHYLHGDCLIQGSSTNTAKLYLVGFSDYYASATIYMVIAESAQQLLSGSGYPVVADKSTLKILRRLLELLYKHQGIYTSPNSGSICELTFNLLMSCLAELGQSDQSIGNKRLGRKEITVVQYVRLIERHYMHHHDVVFYAQQLCMSKGNLGKVIKEVTGKAPKVLLEEKLISMTKNLLDTTQLSIYIIAEEMGFKSSSAFNNFFKSHTHRTPNEYRNRN